MKYKISLRSWILVAIQVVALVYLFTSAPAKAVRIDLQIWELSGLFICLAGLAGLNWHSFSVFPEPKPKGKLVTNGIYGFIRHPMYAGILILTTTLVIQYESYPRIFALLALALVFVLKILKEEEFLATRFPEFEEYRKKTDRLIPFIW
jgi:protein-S-isoprenylcysteine O-methyltransferase Ste14